MPSVKIRNNVYPAYTAHPADKMQGTTQSDPCKGHCVTSQSCQFSDGTYMHAILKSALVSPSTELY